MLEILIQSRRNKASSPVLRRKLMKRWDQHRILMPDKFYACMIRSLALVAELSLQLGVNATTAPKLVHC